MARCINFHQMHQAARSKKVEIAKQEKRKKTEVVQALVQQSKKFRLAGPEAGVRRELPRCARCGRLLQGESRMGSDTCYKCGNPGHMGKDCRAAARLCFRCFQLGHFANECPSAAGPVQSEGPTP